MASLQKTLRYEFQVYLARSKSGLMTFFQSKLLTFHHLGGMTYLLIIMRSFFCPFAIGMTVQLSSYNYDYYPLNYHGNPFLSQVSCSGRYWEPAFFLKGELSKRSFLNLQDCFQQRRHHQQVGSSQKHHYLKEIRLPSSVWPLHYTVKLCPEVQKPFNFSGSVEIEVEVREDTDTVVLNADQLDIVSVSVQHIGKLKNKDGKRKNRPLKRPDSKRKNSKYKGFRKLFLKDVSPDLSTTYLFSQNKSSSSAENGNKSTESIENITNSTRTFNHSTESLSVCKSTECADKSTGNGGNSAENLIKSSENLNKSTERGNSSVKNEHVYNENDFNKNIIVVNLTLIEEDEQVKIELKRKLKKSNLYKIKMDFTGFAQSDLKGMYTTYHNDENGRRRVSLVTQFQTNKARRVFPCFDEPMFRSSFTLILCRKEGYHTVSNMPKIAIMPRKDREGMFWDLFKESVPMPVYLTGFAILDDYAKTPCNDSVFRLDVWSPKKLINSTLYGCEVTPKLLDYFEHYFDIRYSLPKMDLIALPDFGAKGMENWGIVTFA